MKVTTVSHGGSYTHRHVHHHTGLGNTSTDTNGAVLGDNVCRVWGFKVAVSMAAACVMFLLPHDV